MKIYEDLQWRGLIANTTFHPRAPLAEPAPDTATKSTEYETTFRMFPGLDASERRSFVDPNRSFTVYCGFDPTSDSLHVGNLVPLLALRRFQLAGHRPIALAGGATGLIGDPSGKTQERQLLTREALDANIAGVKTQLTRLLDFEAPANPAKLLDNASWTTGMGYLEFLRDVGKHFSVNMMIAKESVRARMENREAGISYTEFSYMLLQAFDFHVLCRDHQCELQIGGSDQWGNITAGIDLCRKKLGKSVYGMVFPLITNADGSKFGKTELGAVWLDPRKTSVYGFYQFWINTDDRDVIRYLKFFTFLEAEQVEALEKGHAANPGAREAHKTLAREVTTLIHGKEATAESVRASEILFGGSLADVSEATFEQLLGEVPTHHLAGTRLDDEGTLLVELLVEARLSSSKGQARKDIDGGGVYLNNMKEPGWQRPVTRADLLFGKHLLLRKGKKNYALLTAG